MTTVDCQLINFSKHFFNLDNIIVVWKVANKVKAGVTFVCGGGSVDGESLLQLGRAKRNV